MTTITADFFRQPSPPSSSSPGSSDASATILRLLEATKSAARAPAGTLQSQAYVNLARVARECAQENWDGYGAKAISQAACDRVRAFLDDLPIWMPAPDIVPEADGELAIEWDLAPNRIFSVSIGESGPLHFAGLFGHEKERHGVEAFDGKISEEILRYINELLRSPAARRVA